MRVEDYGQKRDPGDICYYAAGGNLVFYYADYNYLNVLVRLGRLDCGIEPLLTKGKFPLHIQLLSKN